MKYKDYISIVRFNTSTTDDLSGKTVQPLFSNQSIVQQTKIALDRYAVFTKALEAIYTTQAYNTNNVISAPPNIIRSKGVRFLTLYNKGLRYPLVSKDPNVVYGNFTSQINTGIPGWFLYFADEIQLFPSNSTNPQSTTLSQDIGDDNATITVASTASFPSKNGYVTIGDEVIYYLKKTSTTFQLCTRGVQDTVAVSHQQLETVEENNAHVLYYRLHWTPTVYGDDRILDADANRQMLVCEEHIPVIADYVSYLLLSKVSPERAVHYKGNFDEWMIEARKDINKGRTAIEKSGDVRDALFFEENDVWPGYY